MVTMPSVCCCLHLAPPSLDTLFDTFVINVMLWDNGPMCPIKYIRVDGAGYILGSIH